jgi:hypothetical protein
LDSRPDPEQVCETLNAKAAKRIFCGFHAPRVNFHCRHCHVELSSCVVKEISPMSSIDDPNRAGTAPPSSIHWPELWTWYRFSFLKSFCYYLLLPLTQLVFLALLFNLIGEAYGVDEIIRHDDSLKQAVVGAVSTLTSN